MTQTKRPARKTPAGTIVLTAADLERGHYRSLVDALEDCPGITIGRTGYGDGEQYIRINGEERVLVLMDGRRLNVDLGIDYSNGGFDASTIPDPELIERVEILKGAAGSLYGSGAVGGVPTEVVAWATNDAFIQMWVGTEDKLPRRIRAMFANDPLKLRHDMQLSNWQLNPAHPADTFTSAKAKAAQPIKFGKPAAPPPPPSAKPSTAKKAAAKPASAPQTKSP